MEMKRIHKQEAKEDKLKKYFVKGMIYTTTTYKKDKKSKAYPDKYPVAGTVYAKSPEEAKRIFKEEQEKHYDTEDVYKTSGIDSAQLQAVEVANYSSTSPTHTPMRGSQRIQYDFVPEDVSHLQHENTCVIDNFVGIYSQHLKKVTREWFINQLENIHKITFGVKSIDSSSLDVLFDEEGNEYNKYCVIDSRVLNPETKTF